MFVFGAHRLVGCKKVESASAQFFAYLLTRFKKFRAFFDGSIYKRVFSKFFWGKKTRTNF